MIRPRPPIPEGPYLVVGLARSGVAAAQLLGENVIACDAAEPDVDLPGVEVHLGTDGLELLDRVACVVKSPGVPKEAPAIAVARERGVPVLGEMELAWRRMGNEVVAVTGTNGKTTTTELLGAIHRAARMPVAVAGNVGTPLSALAGTLPPEVVVVCEASSFQLEDTLEFAPECAVLLNVEEDHLDRHGTLEAYREAKLLAFARQLPGDVAVVPPGIEPPGEGRVVVTGFDLALGDDGTLSWEGEPLMRADEVRLRGRHNLENAMAAAAAALARGIPRDAVREALGTFAGVAHRLEEVGERRGVLYVNDSKATNVASAAVGIAAFEGAVHAILGGSPKGGGFTGLRAPLAARARAAYLIGAAEEPLARDLDGAGVPLRRCGDLATAVGAAAAAAVPGDVVLLSPACASFDAYGDYEERGEHFRELVRALA